MTSNGNILLISSITFFTLCIVSIIHLFLVSRNTTIIKTIFIYLLIYGGSTSLFEIYKGKNAPNYGISVGRAIGATLGSIAGFYLGYQVFILSSIFDTASPDVVSPDAASSNELSGITFTLSFVSAEVARLIGSVLGNILLPI